MSSLLTIFVPTSMHATTFEEQAVINGNRVPKTYQPRVWNGHIVVDITLGLFHRMLAGPQGKLWSDSNPEVLEWLGQGDRSTMFCNAFPGSARPPLLPPTPASEKAGAMITMQAPKGTHSFSYGGIETKIGKDGTITVTDTVADVLRSHGFLAV